MSDEIDIKYKLPYAGEHNKGVSFCPACKYEPENLFDHIIGFHSSNVGELFVAECPKCFNKWSAHRGYGSSDYYVYFLESIEQGTNIHFTKETP